MRWKFLGFIKFFHVRVEYILTEADLNCKDVFEMSNTIAMNVLISLQFNSRAKLFDGKSFSCLAHCHFMEIPKDAKQKMDCFLICA